MPPRRVMLIAGEASGDLLAAELVGALRESLDAGGEKGEFFGAGGPIMKSAGVELAFDMTAHAVIGLDALRHYAKFKQLARALLELAFARKPDVIVCVDFSGFNRRFARAVRNRASAAWRPKIVQYVSPQVWASREGRAYRMARDYDLLLAIFPFEKAWYAARVPQFKVEFVGHPILDRHREWRERVAHKTAAVSNPARVVLLPGSRVGELKRHLPVMLKAATMIGAQTQVQCKMVLPNPELLDYVRQFTSAEFSVDARSDGLAEALFDADLAIASTGTVTLECAFFRVPTVALYKTSWVTFQIGKRIVRVQYLAMPNLLANERVFPEFVQQDATAANIAREALDLLQNQPRRKAIHDQLDRVIELLGQPGASRRAGELIAKLLTGRPTGAP
ncbi:MAG: lipid-A-disaccharide synthase, partial [Verrucomicrobia subdivision 3 bacterium]|nr:lipid-A-disaccharide synthase [Limisphaerales bacterium]